MNKQEEKEETSPFRVVDRRRFTEDGGTRGSTAEPSTAAQQSASSAHNDTQRGDAIDPASTGSQAEDSHVPAPPVVQNHQASKKDPSESLRHEENVQEEKQKIAHPPLTFSIFMQSLAQQVMVAMGLLPWPETGLIKVDVQRAQEMIDVIVLLRDKTQGNLTQDEQQLCDALIYQLRIAFVKLRKSAGEALPLHGFAPSSSNEPETI